MVNKDDLRRTKSDIRSGLLGRSPKLFALASVTAVSGFVVVTSAAGCASSNDDSKSGGKSTLGDGGVNPTTPPPGSKTDPTCKATEEFKEPETKPPAPKSTTACTAAVITALADACVADPTAQKCTDARAGAQNKTCADCVFGAKKDAQWKVVNLAPGEKPGAIYNQEGCVENVTGVKDCGHSYMTVLNCFVDYCGTCDQNTGRQCLLDVADKECKAFRITDDACVKATGSKQKEIGLCFPQRDDDQGYKDLFSYMAGAACGGTPAAGEGG